MSSGTTTQLEVAGNAQSGPTPVASRDAKIKEMQCNVFNLGEREEVPLFTRKKRQSQGSSLSSSRQERSQTPKLGMLSKTYSSTDFNEAFSKDLSRQATMGLRPQRSVSGEGMAMREVMNPSVNNMRKEGSKNSRSSSASSKGGGPLTSLSMQQILQPYIALNLIEKTVDGQIKVKDGTKEEPQRRKSIQVITDMQNVIVANAEETLYPKRNSMTVKPPPAEKLIRITMEAIQEVLPLPASAKVSLSSAAGLGNKPRDFNIFGGRIPGPKVKSYAPVRTEKVIKKEQDIDIKPIIQKTLVPVKPVTQAPQSEPAKPKEVKSVSPYLMHALGSLQDPLNKAKRNSLKPQDSLKVMDKVVSKIETEPVYNEIVDLDLTMFRGIGTNHQRSFERNIHGRNSMYAATLSESRSLLFSAKDDWKTFAMNNRRIPKELYHSQVFETMSDQAKARMMFEQHSMLDSEDLSRVRTLGHTLTSANSKSQLEEMSQPRKVIKDDSQVQIVTLELQGLPPNVDETFVRSEFFKGQHIVKFETQRNNLSGRCSGSSFVQLRCQGENEGAKFLETLEASGVRFNLKSVRNLRREGPTTSAVSANPVAHHINTRDLDDQAKNGWLQDMRKQEERKEKLLKDMKQRRIAQQHGLMQYQPMQGGGGSYCHQSSIRLGTDGSTAPHSLTPYNQTVSTPLMTASYSHRNGGAPPTQPFEPTGAFKSRDIVQQQLQLYQTMNRDLQAIASDRHQQSFSGMTPTPKQESTLPQPHQYQHYYQQQTTHSDHSNQQNQRATPQLHNQVSTTSNFQYSTQDQIESGLPSKKHNFSAVVTQRADIQPQPTATQSRVAELPLQLQHQQKRSSLMASTSSNGMVQQPSSSVNSSNNNVQAALRSSQGKMMFVDDKENHGPSAAMTSSATTVILGGQPLYGLIGTHGSSGHTVTHATSKAELGGNFNYDTGMNTAQFGQQFAKGLYTLGGSSNMTVSGPQPSSGGHSQTSSSHFGGGQNSTPFNQINKFNGGAGMQDFNFGVDTSNNNLLLRSSVGGQTTSAVVANIHREVLQDSTFSIHNRLNTSMRDEENTNQLRTGGAGGAEHPFLVKENIQQQVTSKHMGRRSAHVKNNFSGGSHVTKSTSNLMRPTQSYRGKINFK